ncbi:hypothetical protein Saa2_09170 [Streptomyces acidiscabies]|nr:hypothetical protein Saa2_09170 [Streptomyces acidiscabies]
MSGASGVVGLAAEAAAFAARADFATSSFAAAASSAAFSAAAFAFSAASFALSEAATACSVCIWARLPSRSTIATSWSIVAASSSRARAMYWPETRNWRIACAEPSSSARCAYTATCGEAPVRILKTAERSSSACAVN